MGTSLPVGLVDDTVLIGSTLILFLVLDCPFEETFARLASPDSVVIASILVSTDRAGLVFSL